MFYLGLTWIGSCENCLIWWCVRVIISYCFFVSHAHLLSVSKCATTPIYQSVRVHKSTFVGLHRATPLYYFLSVVICFCIFKMYCLFVYSVMQIYLYGVQKVYTEQSHAHLLCLAATCKITWNRACWLIVDFNFTYLAISSCTVLVESWASRKLILVHASVLFNPGHQVIRVSSSDPVTMLIHICTGYNKAGYFSLYYCVLLLWPHWLIWTVEGW